MDRSIKIFSTPFELAESAAESMITLIKDAERLRSPVNLAISGGNTPKLLFSILAERYASQVNWSFANFFWVDERCVPPDDPESNYGEAYRILFRRISIPASNIHRMRGEEDPGKESLRYAKEIVNSPGLSEMLPVFDDIFLGVGDDGHTASIFPGNNHLFESGKICEVTVNPGSGQSRLTLTGSVINNARQVTFLVTGKKKSLIVSQILNDDPLADKYPASKVLPLNGKLIWMIDSAAAFLYKKKPDAKT